MHAHVEDTAVAELGEDAVPVLGAFTTRARPDPEDVAFAVDGDTDRGVVGPVLGLAVADLHVDRVDEHTG